MHLSGHQQDLLDCINEFTMEDNTLNLFIEPPKKHFNLTYCLLTFMSTFENDDAQFKQLVYVVDTNMQAKNAYETFCEIKGVDDESQNFVVKGGKDGSYKIQLTPDGLTYKFISNASTLRGMGMTSSMLFNLCLCEELTYFESYCRGPLKSIWIVRGDKVSDPVWRGEQMKIAESSFCIFK